MAQQLITSVPTIPHPPAELERQPLVLNQRGLGWLSDRIAGIVEGPTPTWWWIAFVPSFILMLVCFSCVAYLISTGVGVWGLMIPVAWAWDITNFVFWIGIGHAGTLISAILFLLRQRWRTSINRAAEAMTIFAVICAMLFPLIHIGRIWYGWWLLPLPIFGGYQLLHPALYFNFFDRTVVRLGGYDPPLRWIPTAPPRTIF